MWHACFTDGRPSLRYQQKKPYNFFISTDHNIPKYFAKSQLTALIFKWSRRRKKQQREKFEATRNQSSVSGSSLYLWFVSFSFSVFLSIFEDFFFCFKSYLFIYLCIDIFKVSGENESGCWKSQGKFSLLFSSYSIWTSHLNLGNPLFFTHSLLLRLCPHRFLGKWQSPFIFRIFTVSFTTIINYHSLFSFSPFFFFPIPKFFPFLKFLLHIIACFLVSFNMTFLFLFRLNFYCSLISGKIALFFWWGFLFVWSSSLFLFPFCFQNFEMTSNIMTCWKRKIINNNNNMNQWYLIIKGKFKCWILIIGWPNQSMYLNQY